MSALIIHPPPAHSPSRSGHALRALAQTEVDGRWSCLAVGCQRALRAGKLVAFVTGLPLPFEEALPPLPRDWLGGSK